MEIRRPLVSAWEADKAGFWDSALNGSSALRAGLERLILGEAVHIARGQAASSLLGPNKCYDPIDPVILGMLAQKLGYPLEISIMGLYIQVGPRLF